MKRQAKGERMQKNGRSAHKIVVDKLKIASIITMAMVRVLGFADCYVYWDSSGTIATVSGDADVPARMFYGNANLNGLIFSPTLVGSTIEYGYIGKRLGNEICRNCKSLQDVDLQYVSEIGDFASSGCENLILVKIPRNLTKIGCGVFGCCEKLSSVDFSENKQFNVNDGIVLDLSGETLRLFVHDCGYSFAA